MKPYFTPLMKKTANYLALSLTLIVLLLLCGCSTGNKVSIKPEDKREDISSGIVSKAPTDTRSFTDEAKVSKEKKASLIDENGATMDTRIHTPMGYTRIPSNSKELTGFLRGLKLKSADSEVMLYDGTPKGDQHGHAAIFDMDIGDKDLQQCADSILRIYAEYYWSIGAYDKISFHLTNGFLMKYTKWRNGYRIAVNGNTVSWKKSGSYDPSYKEFRNFLTKVFIYAGTLSLSKECTPISVDEMRTGDMFIKGGSPGHCVLVVDVAEDDNGNRCFLLAQGYMPAQDFHILKNPLHEEDPWYYSFEITFPLQTPEWTFKEGSLARWGHFLLDKQ